MSDLIMNTKFGEYSASEKIRQLTAKCDPVKHPLGGDLSLHEQLTALRSTITNLCNAAEAVLGVLEKAVKALEFIQFDTTNPRCEHLATQTIDAIVKPETAAAQLKAEIEKARGK